MLPKIELICELILSCAIIPTVRSVDSERLASSGKVLMDPKLSEPERSTHAEGFGNFAKEYPSYLAGYDYDGVPVFVFEFGKFNFKKIREEEEQDFLTFMNSVFAEKLIRTGEKDLQGVAIIMDFDGFTLDSFNSARAIRIGLKMFSYMGKLSSVLRYGFIVNGNFAAELFFNTARPFLGDLLQRIEVYGSRKEEWIPKLLRAIPMDSLPPFYGGSKTFQPISFYGK